MAIYNTEHPVIPFLKKQKAFIEYVRERKKCLREYNELASSYKKNFFVPLVQSFEWAKTDRNDDYWRALYKLYNGFAE